jgi:2-polyprenyl-3-methyl-5-hydroxy-6-metoxy-1,4-benzoquinol methylase
MSRDYVDSGHPTREFGTNGPHVCKCNECGMVYLNPIMDSTAYSTFYNNDEQRKFVDKVVKYDYDTKIAEQTKYRLKILEEALEYIEEASIMDVGSGLSSFATEAIKMDGVKSAIGIEPSISRAKISRERGNNVLNCDIFDDSVEEISSNVITLFQVLEHIAEPIRFLDRAYSLLPRTGYLIVEVPNHDDVLVNLKKYKKFYYQNAHCSYFDDKTLTNLVGMCNFDIVKKIKKQRYSLLNHIRWITGCSFSNRSIDVYNNIVKFFNLHDTLVFVCKKSIGSNT